MAKKKKQKYAPIVQELVDLIDENDWTARFEKAVRQAHAQDVRAIRHVKNLGDYLDYINGLLSWAPREVGDSRRVYDKIVEFYFFLDQDAVRDLQSPIRPPTRGEAVAGSKPIAGGKDWRPDSGDDLTPLSQWIVRYANAWGSYLDTTESAAHVESFRTDPVFNWAEYEPPPSGYLTFNQFFARHTRPGMRPVAGLCDDTVLVAPGDSTFVGWWQISQESEIYVEDQPKLDLKGIQWSIEQLLEGSEYADRFRGGVFTHSFLNTFDYHRWHTPVAGEVLETRVIQGQAYLDVRTKKSLVDGELINTLNALDGTGYQFVQTRGLVVIDSPIGLVACLPMGMAQVSSVVITADVGVTLRKGEELGYFQFGGSDFVMVFERASNVSLTAQPNVHYNQGQCIGYAYSV